MQYENRLVAFLDMLGFSQAVLNSSTQPAELARLFHTLQGIQEIKSNFDGGADNSKMSFFSDSIIISYPLDEIPLKFNPCPIVVYYGMMSLALLAIQVFELFGFLLRGGIAHGELYHENNICFGPALIKAISLEQAKGPPRIVVDENIFMGQSPSFMVNDSAIRSCLSFDTDKAYFIDYLYAYMNIGNAPKIREKICSNLQDENHNKGILEKYKWMKDYFNATISAKPYELPGINEITSVRF